MAENLAESMMNLTTSDTGILAHMDPMDEEASTGNIPVKEPMVLVARRARRALPDSESPLSATRVRNPPYYDNNKGSLHTFV